MEELRLAARAYYNNSSRDLRNLADNLFTSMDTNGDGLISFQEFSRFLTDNGYYWVNANMFSELKTNLDSGLDFWEVLTFYYIIKTRAVWCNACRAQLHGLHFTCIACFDGCQDTYDLCARCYNEHRFHHHHTVFLDNYVLLRRKRGISPGVNVNLAITQPQNEISSDSAAITQPQTSNQSSMNQWFRAMELAIGVGNLLNVGSAVGCSIM